MAVKIIKPVTTISGLDSSVEIGGREDPGNILVRNTGTVPVPNFSFMLRVEGIFDLPCKSITGISRENQFDYIQEGGLNDYVHLKRKPINQPFKFQVERYVGVNWIDPLPLGTELLLPVILFVNKSVFPTLDAVRTYAFTGCTVIAKDYGEMNAESSGLLVEKVTIAYREMVCLDIPSETFEGSTWEFDGKKKEGKGPRNYNSNLFNKEWEETYNSPQQMEERARLSKYAKASEERTPLMAKHNDASMELSADEMQAKAEEAKWVPKKDKEGHLVPKYGMDYERFVSDHNEAIDKEIEAAETAEEKEAAKAKKIAVGSDTGRKYNHSADTPKNYSSAKHHENEATAAEMDKKGIVYRHSSTAKREGAAKYDIDEPSRSAMESNARLWPKKRSARQITDFLKNN